ncbi:MAG: hypothetical protein ACR2NP_01975, partial [Pirellulaceae bacterium]
MQILWSVSEGNVCLTRSFVLTVLAACLIAGNPAAFAWQPGHEKNNQVVLQIVDDTDQPIVGALVEVVY